MIQLLCMAVGLLALAFAFGVCLTALIYRARLAVAEDAAESARDLVSEALGQLRDAADDSSLSGADEIRLAAIAADLAESRGVERALRRFNRHADSAGNPES